ncbi:lecithin retinol acyltransferase family protein [Oscillatoria sp. FACHB-1407]|uniref:lecithin retinol acyltransferase family protein n=1 Tax=Oscillatoria sp. FACHB-1407 TaxID=2692847 RepID=UPI001683FE09|nr:lecithin retinol acyltransferase family protein [Oscillatoria sp. FACHB-1407]MBD2460188.1 lecithin retinol acyltransferase family protein [Oscillatoria sp. FACHB-1407]
MARGDQIYVMRPFLGLNGVYEHHGIDCGDGTVIHYSKAEDIATVRRTSYSAFSMGNPVYIKRYATHAIADVVIQRAESRVGEQQYNLVSNNCEHFATWCKTGINRSEQVEAYGLSSLGIDVFDSNQLVEEAARTGRVDQAIALFQQAHQNITTAEAQLLVQYNRAQTEVNNWHRVALAAMKRREEHLARSALERKVKFKRKAAELKTRLDELATMRENLNRNNTILEQRQKGYL